MKLSLKQTKTATIMVYAVTILFFTACRNIGENTIRDQDVNYDKDIYNGIPDNSQNISITEPVQRKNNQGEGDELQTTEPLVHSIKSTVDIDESMSESILGEFKTYYGDSSQARTENIENAAKKLDGIVINPSEVFSCRDLLAPFTKENGYKPAGTYQNGKIVESIGGGVCQISSTLYNAVLLAELKIVERSAHSMTVSYVDLSMDAAIAGDYKDFKFKNTLKDSVTIHASTEDGWLIFEIEGMDTRKPGRKIEFETEIVSKTEPEEDIITVDEEQEENYEKVTQASHTGYHTELYKIIYNNGIQTDKVLVNESKYNASPKYITVGNKKKD